MADPIGSPVLLRTAMLEYTSHRLRHPYDRLIRDARATLAAAAAMVWLSASPPGAAAQQPAPARATELKFHQYLQQHWSLEQGLPQVGVGDLVQDAHGFLWIATQDGLARFDGLEFEVFNKDNTPGLAGNDIVRLAIDDAGVLWIGTRTGLSRFDGSRFAELRLADKSVGTVHGLTAGPGGLLVASDAGLFRAAGTTLARVPGVPEPRVFFAAPEPDGGLILGLGGVIRKVGPSGAREFPLAPFGEGLVPKLLLRACDGTWIATTGGLYRLSERGLSAVEPLARRNVNDLYCDSANTLWVGTGSGIFRLRNGALVEAIEDEARFAHPFVSAFLQGSDGSLWIGTLTGGLYRLTSGRYIRYNRYAGLSFTATWAVKESRGGGIWVGGQGGLARLRNEQFEPVAGGGSEPAERVVTSLLEDASGRLWIGTRSGLTWTDLKTGRSARVMNAMVLDLAEAPDGAIWIGGLSGLSSFREGRLERHGAEDGIGRVRGLLFSSRYGLVVGTEQGVFVRRQPAGAAAGFERFDAPVFTDSRRVGALFEDEGGDLWVGYLGTGLARFVSATSTWHLYTERDGLLSNTVYGIRVGKDGWLWIATQKGVLRVRREAFDRVDRHTASAATAEEAARARPVPLPDATPALDPDVAVSITGREPGASVGYCCSGGAGSAILLASDGSLWLPTFDGVIRVDTDQKPATHQAPQAVLVSMRHGSSTHLFDSRQTLEVPARERDLEFVFTAPAFDQPALARFRYRLDGYDTGWKEVRGRRSVSYTNLPAGAYRFRVRADTGDPARPGKEAAWPFTIRPRFTETSWFYALMAPLVLGALYGAVALRLRHLERLRARLERQVAERTAQLAEANAALASANVRLEERSYTDPLTQLWNRRYLSDRIERDLAQVARLRDKPGSEDLCIVFALIDIDHFKQINDVHGHDAGDEVLCETARRLKTIARDSDCVVRWGGEEFLFVVCFSPVTTAPRIAERVMAALWRERFALKDQASLAVTGSVGFSVFPFVEPGGGPRRPDPRAWEGVIALADHALYTVKEHGRNGWAGIVPARPIETPVPLQDIARDVDGWARRGAVRIEASFGRT